MSASAGHLVSNIGEERRRARWRDTLRLVGEIARAQPWPLLAMTVFVLIGNARAGVYLVAQGALVDAFFAGDGRKALLWGVIWLGVEAVEETYWATKPWLFAIIRDHAVHRFQRQVMSHAARVPLVAFEQGTFYARLQRASDDIGGKLSTLLMSLVDFLQVLTMGASVAVTLWFVSPWLTPILIVAAIPAVVLETRVAGAVQEALQHHALNSHLLERIERIVRDRDAGAELRLFGSGADLLDRWRATRARRADDVIEAEWRRVRAGMAADAIRGMAFALCIAIALWSITGQHLSIGTWVIVTTGIEWMSGIIRGVATVSRAAREQVAYAGDYFAFEEQAKALLADGKEYGEIITAPAVRQGCAERSKSRGLGIEIDRVSFAYPGNPRPVLHDVSLAIAPGETIAIVGENGAGKSTLVRLVSGLYLPEAGTVTLDGLDTRRAECVNLLSRIAAVFQDYLAFQLPVRDNIGFGDVTSGSDDARLERAAQRAGIRDLVASLPQGYDTWLGRQFGERDLSGGQWQRMALARAFYRDADLLILDEPTAALDPKAEQALFERFADLVEDRTAIMVSHRLASARFADRIVVMDQGRIVEQGSHDALMRRGGLYARMFAAQAEWYR